MKNKKLQYILFPLVIVIWGIIFYQMFSVSGKETIIPGSKVKSSVPLSSDSIIDTFTILADYRDPFLGKVSQKNIYLPAKKPTSIPKPADPETEIMDWSFIKYYGKIRSHKTNKEVALININGRNYLLNKGEEKESVKLVNFYSDSVKVSYKGEEKTIKINPTTN